ncbi:PucR family transcriptional regulator [Streptomyces violaceusniger]|uniref:Transcriptional regulator, PucR family n=1 Tax=Streptomyces violaceusniger (strain Tu 4113) TaxID=653045 RepID=G2P3V6_STRV4|nr:PucR family transcriptional regulator [Streptomyces violaceusniger]AEM84665.1 putative transcriptional regulator, PucR family [Streptomyces violaceusniger Tu 4113]
MRPVTGSRASVPAMGRAVPRLSADRGRTPPRMPAARPPIRSRADAETVALLHRAARVLIEEVPRLADRIVALMKEREPVYRSPSLDPHEVWREVHDSLSNNVRSLVHPKETRESARSCAWRIGTDRAAQGFPLDALLHAYRIGCTVVWEQLLETASKEDPLGAQSLVHVAADVWNFVDEHCTLVATAYQEVERQLSWHRENRYRIIVAALLDGTARVSDFPEAEEALGLPEQGRYAVVALEDADASSRAPHPATVCAGLRTVWHAAEGTAHAIVLLGDVGAERLVRGLEVPPGARAGVSPAVAGLAAVNTARRLADTALRTRPAAGQAALLDERYPEALVVSSPDLGAALADRMLGPVLALESADREMLLTTLATWLEGGGSARRAGELLFCHRNTVLNRLRRYEQLTGRSLDHPREVMELSLALSAHRLLTP